LSLAGSVDSADARGDSGGTADIALFRRLHTCHLPVP